MFEKPSALRALGLEWEGSILRGVQLALVKGKIALVRVFDVDGDLPSAISDHVNPLYKQEQGQELHRQAQTGLAVSVLRSDEVLARSLEVKLKKEKDIDAVLAFQAEPMLPYPLENALLDRLTVASSQEGSLLTLMATRKDYVAQHLAAWHSLQIEPEVISCIPAALAAFSHWCSVTDNPHFLVHLGRTHTTCILVKSGKLLAMQSAAIGLETIQKAYANDLNQPDHLKTQQQFNALNFTNLAPDMYGTLIEALGNWRLEVSRILYSLAKQRKEYEIKEILLSGEGAALDYLGAILCQQMEKQLIKPKMKEHFAMSASDLQRYAVPIGAALSALPQAKDQVNFRQQEFVYPHPWRRLKTPLIIYAGLCCALALSIYIFGAAYQNYEEDQLRKEYVELLSMMNKPPIAFEKEFSSKFFSSRETDELPAIQSLTLEGIADRLQYLQKELKDAPDAFPLHPNIPRVSDVLAWLSTHPKVAGASSEGGIAAPIQIDSFSYTLVKRPEPKKVQEKYQVKVELEFSSPTPKLAREFHDSLIVPNEMVDPKGEVKWSTNKGKYRTSFFLKDKTVYHLSKGGM